MANPAINPLRRPILLATDWKCGDVTSRVEYAEASGQQRLKPASATFEGE